MKRFNPPKTIKLNTNFYKPSFNWKPPKSAFNFQPGLYRPQPIKKSKYTRFQDSDRDGVPNWKDCQPFNKHKQHNDYEKYEQTLKQNIKKTDIIKVVNGYGIYKHSFPTGEILYYAMDMNTGLTILNNRPSLEEIIKDIKKGDPEQLKKRFPEQFNVRETYELEKRRQKTEKKYGDRTKRFRKYGGQKVLDIGAGSNPDYRATHAIDLVKPEKTFKDLNYKYGYDFNKESTNLPYPDNYFDVVVSYGGLGRNFESKNICKEIYRVLKPGGRFEFNPDTDNSVKWIKEAGFKNLHMEEYFDEYLNQKISIIIANK